MCHCPILQMQKSFGEGCVPPDSLSRSLLSVVAFKAMEVWKPICFSPQSGCSPLGYVALQTPPLLISFTPDGLSPSSLCPSPSKAFLFHQLKHFAFRVSTIRFWPKFQSTRTARQVSGHRTGLRKGVDAVVQMWALVTDTPELKFHWLLLALSPSICTFCSEPQFPPL